MWRETCSNLGPFRVTCTKLQILRPSCSSGPALIRSPSGQKYIVHFIRRPLCIQDQIVILRASLIKSGEFDSWINAFLNDFTHLRCVWRVQILHFCSVEPLPVATFLVLCDKWVKSTTLNHSRVFILVLIVVLNLFLLVC